MSQAQTLTDAELDAVSGGDAVAAVSIVSLSVTGPPGVPVSVSIAAASTAGAPPSATVAVGVGPATAVVGMTLTQAVTPA